MALPMPLEAPVTRATFLPLLAIMIPPVSRQPPSRVACHLMKRYFTVSLRYGIIAKTERKRRLALDRPTGTQAIRYDAVLQTYPSFCHYRQQEVPGVTETPAADPRVQRSRRAVLDASIALFLEGGANALTVDAVSERSGVAKTTIYRHWENRDALVIDVVRGCIPVVEHPDAELPFEEALRQAVRSMAAGLSDDRVRAALPHLIAAAAEMWDLGADYREVVEKQYAGLIGVLERGVAEGSLPEDADVLEAKHQIFGPIFVTALSPDDPLGDDEADRVVELFLASRCRD